MASLGTLEQELREEAVHRGDTDPLRPVLFFAGSVSGGSRKHVHQGMELAIALDGAAEFEVAGVISAAEPGDVWLVGMWEPHRMVQEREALVATFQFLPEATIDALPPRWPWLSMFSVPPTLRPRVASEQGREVLLRVVAEMCREMRDGSPLWQTVIYLGLLRILVELQRGWEGAEQTARGSAAHDDVFWRIKPAIELLVPGLGRRVDAREAARACSVSLPWFDALFRRAMGVSFSEFSLRSRVGFAARELLTSSQSVHTIAEREGFTDASHLHRSFLRHFGCTPSQYRAQGMSGNARYEGVFWQSHEVPEKG